MLTLNPEHISCYALKVEEGTPLYDCREFYHLPSDDVQADMYLAMCDILKSKGFRQYEISNFARKGLYSRHNMKYWTGGEYLGFGPSASSDFAGRRFTIVRDIQGYIQGIQTGGEVLEEIDEVPLRERAGEYLMLRLRTTSGIYREEYERKFLLPFDPIAEAMELARSRGQAEEFEGRWRLTPKGFLVSNAIISDLLLIQEKSRPIKRF